MKNINLYLDYLAEEALSDAMEAAMACAEAEAEAEVERMDWEDELREALRDAADAEDWDLYSDLFKDLYGFRPRGEAWGWYN